MVSSMFQHGVIKLTPLITASACFSQNIQKSQSKCETRSCAEVLAKFPGKNPQKFWTAKCSLRVKHP